MSLKELSSDLRLSVLATSTFTSWNISTTAWLYLSMPQESLVSWEPLVRCREHSKFMKCAVSSRGCLLVAKLLSFENRRRKSHHVSTASSWWLFWYVHWLPILGPGHAQSQRPPHMLSRSEFPMPSSGEYHLKPLSSSVCSVSSSLLVQQPTYWKTLLCIDDFPLTLWCFVLMNLRYLLRK